MKTLTVPKLLEFQRELSALLNRLGVDSALETADDLLAASLTNDLMRLSERVIGCLPPSQPTTPLTIAPGTTRAESTCADFAARGEAVLQVTSGWGVGSAPTKVVHVTPDGQVVLNPEATREQLIDAVEVMARSAARLNQPVIKPDFILVKEGNQWIAARGDFKNLQESEAAFGGDPWIALQKLLEPVQENAELQPVLISRQLLDHHNVVEKERDALRASVQRIHVFFKAPEQGGLGCSPEDPVSTLLAYAAEWNDQRKKLQQFKDFVHKTLDDIGVPADPGGEHTLVGCRIGDRLELVRLHWAGSHPVSIAAMDVLAELKRQNDERQDPYSSGELASAAGVYLRDKLSGRRGRVIAAALMIASVEKMDQEASK